MHNLFKHFKGRHTVSKNIQLIPGTKVDNPEASILLLKLRILYVTDGIGHQICPFSTTRACVYNQEKMCPSHFSAAYTLYLDIFLCKACFNRLLETFCIIVQRISTEPLLRHFKA